MYKNQIGHFFTLSLKYFFNIDPAFCNHAFLIAFLIIGVFRFFLTSITAYFYDGLQQIKEDAMAVKSLLLDTREKWEHRLLNK
jgi:hypothetical protein